VRAEARRQELAIRAALGAGWGRIVRELLIESVLLGLMGGALGVGVAFGGLRLLVAAGPANLPRLHEISLDGRALAFTFVLSLISALLFGSIPAFKYAGRRIALGGRTFSAGRERRRTRNVLVVAQVALAVVLLISSGLMIRTFQALHNVEPGFTHPEQIQAVRIAIPRSQMPDEEQVTRTQNAILDKLAAIPGVASAGFVTSVPLERLQMQLNPILAESRGDAAAYRRGDVLPTRSFKYVSPGYLGTMGAKLVLGRDLAWADIYNPRRFALVSENLAREVGGSLRMPLASALSRLPESPGTK